MSSKLAHKNIVNKKLKPVPPKRKRSWLLSKETGLALQKVFIVTVIALCVLF